MTLIPKYIVRKGGIDDKWDLDVAVRVTKVPSPSWCFETLVDIKDCEDPVYYEEGDLFTHCLRIIKRFDICPVELCWLLKTIFKDKMCSDIIKTRVSKCCDEILHPHTWDEHFRRMPSTFDGICGHEAFVLLNTQRPISGFFLRCCLNSL